MKIIYSDFKKGEVKIRVTNLDDLWHLSQIIDKGDVVKGQTLRKIKVGSEGSEKVDRKVVFLAIKIEKTEFSKYSDVLRVSGVVIEGPEDVPRGEHHTFNVELNSIITIEKENWLKYQIDRLKEASIDKSKILIVIMDREEANFAISKDRGYEFFAEIKGDVAKKADNKIKESKFYFEIIEKIKEYVERYKIDNVIIASPAFWKEDLFKVITDDKLKKKITLATCSSSDKSSINEVLNRNEVQQVLKQDRILKETKLVDELLREISKDGLATYGLDDVENSSNAGAIRTLIMTDGYIKKSRNENFYQKIEAIMKNVDNLKGDVFIISSENDAGKKLDGLGGIAALLRYKLNY